MKKVRFIKDFKHGNKHVDKKGTVKLVTDNHATRLKEQGFAEEVKGKEDKEARERETK